MKIGVYGSAIEVMDDEIKEKARLIGRTIAENKAILVTGGCPGLPYEAVLGASEKNGRCVAFSSAIDLAGHKQANYPTLGFSDFIFVPQDYEYAANEAVCKKYRNVSSVACVDAAIIISGRIGTMNEFTIAYDLGKTIGVLAGTGGITERAIKILLEDADKKTGAKVIFDPDPRRLVALICQK
ncbi:MAG: hypothetical protein A2445_01365 [Candidatus Jacksonbacteria bacterium RIFOXYC2_FULL_44_29]|nr:MAG: hypothetical protein A2295_02180 [Candidatus Jacksonbacteria bacterium RIFOXYB2_FULL_44_15]OGY76553.1 MAG: hypothetical protein A2240_03805 [Candidatus Jacksonbacteria bacterium RIFOXYA2_FULL_43_12]OGY78519.1 MAG: hypothetical protein A2445_01365 [Candidatus Jacksonbacteria bacterium RIFOXYC2_FULL_44_29]OGY81182.1 MAG: hypothetical protein A2550_01760 [Candidatus Jacksonbacteria bacterium RIFOXYD2_FULL_43_21]HBH45778.1 hypothetical protein [Candidatus Jacksonbacteria bacterium]